MLASCELFMNLCARMDFYTYNRVMLNMTFSALRLILAMATKIDTYSRSYYENFNHICTYDQIDTIRDERRLNFYT